MRILITETGKLNKVFDVTPNINYRGPFYMPIEGCVQGDDYKLVAPLCHLENLWMQPKL